VTTLRKIAEALLDAWPNVQTRCDFDQSTQLYKTGRIDRQPYGSRFMLGVVSVGDAARYGLRSAALETKPGKYVGPSDAALGAAVRLAKQARRGAPFTIDQNAVRKDGHAYPGTMIVYTAAKLADLAPDDAEKVAKFVKVSTSEGQVVGGGNGELPAGYLPIKAKGVTAKLYDAAQDVGRDIAAQDAPTGGSGASTDAPTPTQPPTPVTSSEPLPTGAPEPAGVPTTTTKPKPSSTPTATPSASATEEPEPVEMPPTQFVSSRTATGLVPALLLVGLVALAVSAGLRAVFNGRR
jgi:hypothetical protein